MIEPVSRRVFLKTGSAATGLLFLTACFRETNLAISQYEEAINGINSLAYQRELRHISPENKDINAVQLRQTYLSLFNKTTPETERTDSHTFTLNPVTFVMNTGDTGSQSQVESGPVSVYLPRILQEGTLTSDGLISPASRAPKQQSKNLAPAYLNKDAFERSLGALPIIFDEYNKINPGTKIVPAARTDLYIFPIGFDTGVDTGFVQFIFPHKEGKYTIKSVWPNTFYDANYFKDGRAGYRLSQALHTLTQYQPLVEEPIDHVLEMSVLTELFEGLTGNASLSLSASVLIYAKRLNLHHDNYIRLARQTSSILKFPITTFDPDYYDSFEIDPQAPVFQGNIELSPP